MGSGATGRSGATGGSGAIGGSGATEERPTMDVRRAVNTTGGGTKVEILNVNNSDKMFNVRTCPLWTFYPILNFKMCNCRSRFLILSN